MRKKIKILLGAFALFLNLPANAALITFNHLETDTNGDIITDTLSNREYLRLDVLADLTYQQTLSITSVGGTYEGWSIANNNIANDFVNAFIGLPNACDGVHTGNQAIICGNTGSMLDGDLGNTLDDTRDPLFFLNAEGTLDVGLVLFSHDTGRVFLQDDWSSFNNTDRFSAQGTESQTPVSWLVYRQVSIPEPSILTLFGAGIIGLGFVRRRKSH